MEWLEADPIPEECGNCKEADCYNCDTAAERWSLSRLDDLRIKRKLICRGIQRLQRKLADIDHELDRIEQITEQGNENP